MTATDMPVMDNAIKTIRQASPTDTTLRLLNDLDERVVEKQKLEDAQQKSAGDDNMIVSATFKVINLPELLELVLRKLHARELCRLFPVSRYFLTLINSSIHLRRRLWWEPNPKLSAYLSTVPRFLNPHLGIAKDKGGLPIQTIMTRQSKDGALNVWIHFSSMASLRGMYCGDFGLLATWRFMIVRQPYDERTVWSLGVCEDGCQRYGHRKVGVKCEGLKESSFRVEGSIPTMGYLVDELVERFEIDASGRLNPASEGNA